VSVEVEDRTVCLSPLWLEGSLATKTLPTLLSLIAGSADVISFLGFGGLFTAHITGNLVILAAHVVTGDPARLAPMLSVPVFTVVLVLTRLLAGGLEAIGIAPLRPLLLVQFLLLGGFLVLSVAIGPRIDPNAANAILAGMLGVSAMAVQNALVEISLKGAPATSVMTTDITRFMIDVGAMLFRRDPHNVAQVRSRAHHTWPVIVGFVVGCGLGALCQAAIGMWSLALPAGLALLALAMSFSTKLHRDGADATRRSFQHVHLSKCRSVTKNRERQSAG
jgi:uncharacterized membrane protein YoaK (UPF0700 family)